MVEFEFELIQKTPVPALGRGAESPRGRLLPLWFGLLRAAGRHWFPSTSTNFFLTRRLFSLVTRRLFHERVFHGTMFHDEFRREFKR
jgi:hypothetical protein